MKERESDFKIADCFPNVFFFVIGYVRPQFVVEGACLHCLARFAGMETDGSGISQFSLLVGIFEKYRI